MASFHGAYLKYECIDSAEYFIWYSEKCLSFCPSLVVPIGNHVATVYPKAPRLLPACALSHGARALNYPDLGHATKEHRDTPSAYPDSDRQMKLARPICKASEILGCAPILMTSFTGFNHNFWDRGKGLQRLLLDKIVSCYVPRSIHFWGCIGNSHCRILYELHMYLFLDKKDYPFREINL